MYGTVQEIKDFTGIQAKTLNIDETRLNELLELWLTWISSEIDTRLKVEILPTDPRYTGITGVAIRTVAKLVNFAIQNRKSPIVQVNEFAVRVVNYSDVISTLDIELRPYYTIKNKLIIFSSADPIDPTTGV